MSAGLQTCLDQLKNDPQIKGLLLWFFNREMPFPMNLAAPKFDAVRKALLKQDFEQFEVAAKAVVGLGSGLTPSGDDFLGGIFYANFHLDSNSQIAIKKVAACAHEYCTKHSHPKSAAIMHDLIHGKSQGALEQMLEAIKANNTAKIRTATQNMYTLGSSSGADMLAGVLTYLHAIDSTTVFEKNIDGQLPFALSLSKGAEASTSSARTD